jgi:hypothetical protein
MVRVAVGLVLAGLLVGCGNARPTERWFALTERYEPRGDFEASVLVRVDPQTLQPVEGRSLRLGDYATSHSLSPDRRTLAFGGANDGELLFVDLSHPRVLRRMTVAPPAANGIGESVDVIGWPRQALLLAVATPNTAWWAPHPSRLLLVDPQQRRVLQRTPLRGGLIASLSLRDGTVALLGATKRFPTLLVLRPDGSSWATQLRRLDLGGRDGVTLGGVYYSPERIPALATDGKRLFIVASDRPIAEILPARARCATTVLRFRVATCRTHRRSSLVQAASICASRRAQRFSAMTSSRSAATTSCRVGSAGLVPDTASSTAHYNL